MKHIYILFLALLWPLFTFAQFQPEPDPFRINMLGCIRQYNPAPALASYPKLDADVSLWIGDNIYADTQTDPAIIQKSYEQLASFDAFQQLKEQTHFIATWDDHDYGDNNEGRYYPLKQKSKAIFRTFWGLEDKIPAERDGIYYSESMEVQNHTIQFIMLDTRFNRDDVDPLGRGDVLGENQWAWLENQLQKPADIRFIASGFQILLNKENGSETWMKFPNAHKRLMETIKTSGAEGVLFLAGDQHYAEVNRMENALDYDAIELQFASVNQIEDPENNVYRVSSVAASQHTYAYIDLFLGDYEEDQRYIQFTVKAHETGETEVSYRVNLKELYRNVQISGAQKFKDSTIVRFNHGYDHLNLHITQNGTTPSVNSPFVPKNREITLYETTTLKAALFDQQGNRRSIIYGYEVEKLTSLAPADIDEQHLTGGLHYVYVEGEYEKIPQFSGKNFKKEGIAHTFDPVTIAMRDDHYAIRYSGYIKIDKEGLYTFATRSDDGSKLSISGHLVVDNDGSHSEITRDGIILLKKGYHPIIIDYFEDYSGQSLQVMSSYGNGNERKRQSLENVSFDQLFVNMKNTDE